MNAEAGLLAPYRAVVADDARAVLEGLEFSHAELLRRAWSEREGSLVTPSLCLLTAELLGGDPSSTARPLATALAFLDVSVSVLSDLAFDDEAVAGALQAAWGMPRVLNAGDAFFVLAQQSVLRLQDEGLSPARVLDATTRFEEVAARCWQALAAGGPVHAVLTSGALSLGAWTASASSALVDALAAASPAPGVALSGLDLPAESKRRLNEATAFAMSRS